MTNRRSFARAAAAVGIFACAWMHGAAAESTASPAPTAQAASAQTAAQPTSASRALAKLLDDYFEATLVLNPLRATSIGDNRYNDRFEVDLGPEWLARSEKLARDSLAALDAIDRSQLSERDQLSYDIFKSGRAREIEGEP